MTNKWTTDNIPDLAGKVVIITGANSGIGFEAAKQFARKGAQTILACRSIDKAQSGLDQILTEFPNASVEVIQLDLANLASIQKFVESFTAKYQRLDILINNAGIMMVPYAKTGDGFESQFGTNHLGHFALTGQLLKILLPTPKARVVNISSAVHNIGVIDFDNLMYEGRQGYTKAGAYGRSKLSNLLFTYELQRRFEKIGANTIAVAAHPGSTNTNLQDEIAELWYLKPFIPLMRMFMQDTAMGALPTLRAAVDPKVKGAQYYGPDRFMEQLGHPVIVQSNKASYNQADAAKLWQVSEELTGIHYNWKEN